MVAPNGTVPFDNNGPMSAGITHSTVSNTDQITVNTAGTYRIDYATVAAGAMFFAVAVNGVVQATSEYGANTGGTVLAGRALLSLASGDVITIVNYSLATTTTLSNVNNLNPRIAASVIIQQVA